MKNLLILFAVIVVLFAPDAYAAGNYSFITGLVTQETQLIVTVIVPSPELTLHSPIDGNNYITNNSLLLNFSSLYARNIWYNLDNNANISVLAQTYFNTSDGQHTLYLFANNTDGTIIKRNSSFFVNQSKITIIFEDLLNEGETTNIFTYSYEQMQNLSSLVFHRLDEGKIVFIEIINITESDGIVDIDGNLNISANRIEINSSGLSQFNKSAKLYLYGLSFSDPMILRDGLECPEDICIIESYSFGNLVFNVTGFSTYSAEERPSEDSESENTGGGGGGSAVIQSIFQSDINVNPETIAASLRQGETKMYSIDVENNENTKKIIEISVEKLEKFIKIRENKIELQPGEKKTVYFDFVAPEDSSLEIHTGKIIFKTKGISKEVLVAISINSQNALFDVALDIPENYHVVEAGNDLLFNVKVFNLGKVGKVDVLIEYYVTYEGNEILKETESVAVETQTNLVKILDIPEGTREGQYSLNVKVKYFDGQKESVATASHWFMVKEMSIGDNPLLMLIIILITTILFFMTGIVIFIIYNNRKMNEIITGKKYDLPTKVDMRKFLEKFVKR